MASYHRTEGICLRRIPYSNTSQVASFLTADSGRLSFLAKGATRASRKGVRTGIDLLCRYGIIYVPARGGSLQTLTDRWLQEDFRGMRGALERILCGYYAAELPLNFTAEGEPCPDLYALMCRTLRRIASGRALGASLLLLELGVLREHGSCPSFDRCAECSSPLPERGPVLFSPAAGGPLCRHCETALPQAHAERATSFKADVLRGLAQVAAPPSEELPRPAPDAEKVLAMSTVLRFYMRDLLGKELHMWKYLQQRHLSRSLTRLRRRTGLRPAGPP